MSSQQQSARVVKLVSTSASLQGGQNLDHCQLWNDETCIGGVASVGAYSRHLDSAGNNSSSGGGDTHPFVVVPQFDRSSYFAQMHPLGWSVNRLVLAEIMQWDFFVSAPSILDLGNEYVATTLSESSRILRADRTPYPQFDFEDLQSEDLPVLVSNDIVPPSNTWFPYSESVHLDLPTGLALISVFYDAPTESILMTQTDDTLSAVKSSLGYIARLNGEAGCNGGEKSEAYYPYQSIPDNATVSDCWIPVVVVSCECIDVYDGKLHDLRKDSWESFLDKVVQLENPPALLLDTTGISNENYGIPTQQNRTWILGDQLRSDIFYQQQLTITSEAPYWISNVEHWTERLADLPEAYKDALYVEHVSRIAELGLEAAEHDPVAGVSTEMPPAADENGNLRCAKAECQAGNLFADSIRWWANADVAFVASESFRGKGWPAGSVKTSSLWETLPVSNSICTGTMSGISLFKLFNHSMNAGLHTNISGISGNSVVQLQVSGIQVRYNTNLQSSRLVALAIWNSDEGLYQSVDRLQLYRFATDSSLCLNQNPYPSLLVADLNIDGEDPGTVNRNHLHQNAVSAYLSSLNSTYQTRIDGRIMEDVTATEALNLVLEPQDCPSGTYWLETKQSCFECPDTTQVFFSKAEVDFLGESGSSALVESSIDLFNNAGFDVGVGPKSFPSWFRFTNISINGTKPIAPLRSGDNVILKSGETLVVGIAASASNLEAGMALGSVSFGILDSGTFPGCIGMDVGFDIFMRVAPAPEAIQLGAMRWVGLSLFLSMVCTALILVLWVRQRRTLPVITSMNESFLHVICFGAILLSAVAIPLSLDDGLVSARGCDAACASIPWLLALGFSVIVAALYTKLQSFRMNEEDFCFKTLAVSSFGKLFILEVLILLPWWLADPLHWERIPIDRQEWKSYGRCTWDSPAGIVLLSSFALMNVAVLAFLARLAMTTTTTTNTTSDRQQQPPSNRSDRFDQNKSILLVLFSWTQLLVVGIPVLLLIQPEASAGRYFWQVAVVIGLAVSLLVCLFVPIYMQQWKAGNASLRLGGMMGWSRSNLRNSGTT